MVKNKRTFSYAMIMVDKGVQEILLKIACTKSTEIVIYCVWNKGNLKQTINPLPHCQHKACCICYFSLLLLVTSQFASLLSMSLYSVRD